LTSNLSPEVLSVCNNASWALGEIAIKVGAEIKPYVESILIRLMPIQNNNKLHRNLLENTAITIGRLGLVCPDVVSSHLSEFIQQWCLSLRNIRDDTEKDSAFRGLCNMIKFNPAGVVNSFPYLCDAIASWQNPKSDLRDMFFQILHGFKNSLGNEWDSYFNSFPPTLRMLLQERYKL